MTDRPRDLIAHLVGAGTNNSSVPVEFLEAVQDGVETPAALADSFLVSRKTVYRALNPLAECGAVIHSDGRYESTGLGAVLCRLCETALENQAVDYDTLGFLVGSENRLRLLEALREEPKTKAELATGDRTPSRATVHRTTGRFEEYDWIRPTESGQLELTDIGREAIEGFSELLESVQYAQQRAEFLYCCGDAVADIPLKGAAAAEMYEHTPVAPDRLRSVYQDLFDTELDRFRGLLSQVSLALADIGDSIIQSGTETELVITEPVLYNLPTEGHYAEHVKRGLEAQNHTLLIAYDYEDFPVALGICDGTVMIGPATAARVPGNRPAGVIVGTDEELVEWAIEEYEKYRSEASPLSRHLLKRLKDAVSGTVSR
jgi:predicted transcriptional regulator